MQRNIFANTQPNTGRNLFNNNANTSINLIQSTTNPLALNQNNQNVQNQPQSNPILPGSNAIVNNNQQPLIKDSLFENHSFEEIY